MRSSYARKFDIMRRSLAELVSLKKQIESLDRIDRMDGYGEYADETYASVTVDVDNLIEFFDGESEAVWALMTPEEQKEFKK